MKLMFDFQVLAFQSDMTRVFSFKTGRDASSRAFPESGTDKGFHPASHHGGREAGRCCLVLSSGAGSRSPEGI